MIFLLKIKPVSKLFYSFLFCVLLIFGLQMLSWSSWDSTFLFTMNIRNFLKCVILYSTLAYLKSFLLLLSYPLKELIQCLLWYITTNRCSEDKTIYILILSWEFSSFINKECNLTCKSILHPLYEDLKTDSDHMVQLSNPLPDNLIKENVLTHVFYHRQDLKGHSNSTLLRFGPMSIFTGASCFLKVGFSPFFDSLEQCFSALFHYCTLRNLCSLFFFSHGALYHDILIPQIYRLPLYVPYVDLCFYT